jgi:hypothetical protein
MLHKIGDAGLGRTYIVQDFVMPGPAEACALSDFTGDATADSAGPGAGCVSIWPLWICPVRMVAKRHDADAGMTCAVAFWFSSVFTNLECAHC